MKYVITIEPLSNEKPGSDPDDELPFETWQRVIGSPWPGGKSRIVRLLLQMAGITDPPGSAEANLQLQERLMA